MIRTTRTFFFVAALAGLLGTASCATGEASFEDVTHAAAEDAAARFAGIPQQGNRLGDPRAPVTLQVFSDLRCGHCRVFEQDLMLGLVDRYVRAGKVQIIAENLPILGPQSTRAAQVAVAAGEQGKMFEFIDVFFQRTPGPVDDEALHRVAASIPGIDVDRVFADADSQRVKDELADARQRADSFHIRGTPTLVVGKTGEAGQVVRQRSTVATQIDALLGEH
jgi:protein-disulfide isomerase